MTSQEENERILDEAIAAQKYSIFKDAKPCIESILTDQEVPDPLTFDQLALRGIERISCKTSTLIDKRLGLNIMGGLDMVKVKETMQEDAYNELPEALRPPQGTPLNTKMNVICQHLGGDVYNVYLHYLFDKPLHKSVAKKLTVGVGYVPVWRQDQWGLRRGFHATWMRILGHHFNHSRLVAVDDTDRPTARLPKWRPTKKKLEEGRLFINRNVPLDNSENEQLFWIQLNTRVDEASPLYDWPEYLVQKAADNRVKARQCSDVEKFFPLLSCDLHPSFKDTVLPLLLMFAPTHGIMFIGMPDVGKTPLAMMMAMAIGRYHIRAGQLDKVAGFRRGKSMDNFRNKPGEKHEGILLDDATQAVIDIEDTKSFGDVGEVCSFGESRYSPAKFTRGQCRFLLNNKWGKDSEPAPSTDRTIPFEAFKLMFRPLLGKVTDTDFMATLKRFVVVIFGENALYLRPPSADVDMPVFRFDLNNAHKDVLVPDHKEYLAKWKQGRNEKYEGYDEEMKSEDQTIDDLMGRVAGMEPDQITKFWIENYADTSDATTVVVGVAAESAAEPYNVIPATPETGMTQVIPLDRGGAYDFHNPRIGTGSRMRETFVFAGGSAASTNGASSSSGPRAPTTPPQSPRAPTGETRFSSQSSQSDDGPVAKKLRIEGDAVAASVKEEPTNASVLQTDWKDEPVPVFAISDSE